jgi:hypothetical protein
MANAKEQVFSGILRKIFSDDTVKEIAEFINAVDPWKWGSRLTEGEAHYINEIVVDEIYEPDEGTDTEPSRSVVDLVEVYEDLSPQFAYFRRGWVAEYIGETFGENEFKRFMFIIGARVPGGQSIVDSINTLEFSPGAPSSGIQKGFAVIWASFFFFMLTSLIGFSQRIAADPFAILDPAVFPIMAIWWLSYAKWYGKYGMYIPFMGTQSFWSAMSTVGLYVFSIAVIARIFPFFSLDGIPMFLGWRGGSLLNIGWGNDPMGFVLSMPNPFLLGTGHLIRGMGWSNTLLFWGLSGVGNVFYGEWAKAHSTLGNIARQRKKQLQDLKKDIIKAVKRS